SFCSTARIFCLLFFAYTTTTEIYTLSLHDALPISSIKTPLSDKTKFSCFARRKYRQRQLTAFVSSTTPGKNAFYGELPEIIRAEDRKSTRLNSSHVKISYAVFCLKKKNIQYRYIDK